MYSDFIKFAEDELKVWKYIKAIYILVLNILGTANNDRKGDVLNRYSHSLTILSQVPWRISSELSKKNNQGISFLDIHGISMELSILLEYNISYLLYT